ncbi:unnamed protein product [Orchesella dallaii]|uniref:Uncharacterized protein n=1 Tax=Orchesella dallaii TaxID=48710 RepID=A0ABP1QND0_9HEXA
MEENKALELVTAVGSVSDDAKILQSLNLNLQVRVHNLESENTRLKAEVQSFKGKSFMYESLSKDLASLRKQFDKTAAALLRKCEAYDALKKEVTALKFRNSSPKSTLRSMKISKDFQVSNFQSKLALYEAMEYSSDEDCYGDKARRPSMGSCGNLLRQISADEVQPSDFGLAPPAAPLRNRLLIKLHSLKAASTESLASTGRKSIRAQEIQLKPVKSTTSTTRKIVPMKARLDTSVQSTRPAPKAPPSIRPALSQNNGHPKLIKMNNMTNIKRTNSNCSTKSAPSKPVFRV